MDQKSIQQGVSLAMSALQPIAVVRVQISIPVNLPEVVTIHDSGFRIDTTKMEENLPYVVESMGSQYIMWKRKDGALVVEDM